MIFLQCTWCCSKLLSVSCVFSSVRLPFMSCPRRVMSSYCALSARKPEGSCFRFAGITLGLIQKPHIRLSSWKAIIGNILRRRLKHKNKDEEHNLHFGNNYSNVPNVNVKKKRKLTSNYFKFLVFFQYGKAHWPGICKVLFLAQSCCFFSNRLHNILTN